MATLTPAHAALAQPVVGSATRPAAAPVTAPIARAIQGATPYRETYAWQLVKHAALLGVIAAAIVFVFTAGRSPMLSIAYAASSLVFLSVIALLDRHRFESSASITTAKTPAITIQGHARTWTVAAPAMAQPVVMARQPISPQPVVQPRPAYAQPSFAQVQPDERLAPLAYEMAAALTTPVSVT